MARQSAQNASHPQSHFSRDISNANLTSYTGVAAAQCAVDSSTDLDEYLTSPLDMQTETTPRSFPPGHSSRARITSHLAAFSGDPSFPSPDNYYLTRESQSGLQNYSAVNRQSIDLSSDPSSSTSHHRSDFPWTPLDATGAPTKTIRQTRPTSSTDYLRTPSRLVDHFPRFQHSGFHDSAIGTISGPSQDERQTVLSSPLTDMDPTLTWYSGPEPQEVELQEEEEDDSEEQGDRNESESQVGHGDDQPPSKQKPQRQSRSKEELTCDACGVVSKTPSDFKKHQSRHALPWTCDYEDCQRSTKGFATVNDLHRHKKSVHGVNARGSKYHKCFAPNCQKSEKKWPRLDNFKQHLARMHADENVDELLRRSDEWYEEQYGMAGHTQSPAITDVLHSQEKAARVSKKRRRGSDSPSPAAPPQKRTAMPPLQTQGMPPQDFTRLSPLSAQPMSRHNSAHSQQQMQPPSLYNMQNAQFGSYQRQWTQPYGQMQSPSPMTPGLAIPNQRRGTEGHIRRMMQPPNQSTDPFSFTSDNSYNYGRMGPGSQPPTYDQRSQAPQGTPQPALHPRAHTAPDANADFNQIQMALIDQSHAIPPGQDDIYNMNQYLAELGSGTNVMQSSPDTSNGPHTPSQSVPLPVIAVDNDSDDAGGQVTSHPDLLAEEVRSLLHQHGTKNEHGHLLLSSRSLESILESIANRSSRASASNTGTSQKSVSGSGSSRAGKTNHFCSKCHKSCPRQSDLKKHMKRHSRPYGCVVDNCYKSFGSKNDLKRHETNMHSEQKECYRCDGRHQSEDGGQCFQVFYHGRDNYKKHLERCLTRDLHLIEKTANACRIPANNQGRFWCGFCNKIVDHEIHGSEASSQRLSHIDSHFSQGKGAHDWIELGGNGLTKRKVEIKHNEARNQQIQARGLHLAQQLDEGDSQGSSSSSSSSDNQVEGDSSQSVQGSQSSSQHQMQAPTLPRQRSNSGQYQQMVQQQMYQQHQLALQMQRANSQGHVPQRANKFRDPPQKRHNENGQPLARHATCCRCDDGDWMLDLSKQCTNCDHHLCRNCRVRS